MASKKRKRPDDPTPALTRATRSTTAPPRSTMRVAAANKWLGDQLPGIIYTKPEKIKTAQPVQPVTIKRPPATTKAKAPQKPKGDTLELRKKPEALGTCKKRPKSSKGSGGSRAFVPWCR